MKKITVLFFWCVFLLFLAVRHHEKANGPIGQPSSPKAQIGQDKFSDIQKELLDLHNKERKSKGYQGLELDKDLCEYAQKHAEKMAKSNSLNHSSMSNLQKVNEDASFVGENIACGQEDGISVVKAWMKSTGHRWNILGSKYKKVGIGVAKDKNNRNYWCVVFSD